MRILIWFLFLTLSLVHAQEPVSIHLTEKDGLPDKEFYGVVEDSRGLIWFAGNKGLTRFDGKNYKTYSHPEKRGLSVFEIAVDKKDRVWCINISGQIFYVENDEMFLFKDLKVKLNGHLPELNIYNDQLVVSCYLFVEIFDLTTKTSFSQDKERYQEVYLNSFEVEGTVVYSYNNDFYTLKNGIPELWQEIPESFLTANRKDPFISTISRSFGKNQVLIYIKNKSNEISFNILENEKWSSIPFPKELEQLKIVTIYRIDDQFWLCTSKGIVVLQLNNKRLTIKKRLLQNYYISSVLKDRDKNYWVTTTSNGIFVLPNIYIETITTPSDSGNTRVLSSDGNSHLFIGTSSGKAFNYNTETSTIEELKIVGNNPVSEIIYDPYRMQTSFLQDVGTTTLDENNLPVRPILNFKTVKKGQFISADSLLIVSSTNGAVVKVYADESDTLSIVANFLKRGYTCHYDPLTGNRYYGLVDELVKIGRSREKDRFNQRRGRRHSYRVPRNRSEQPLMGCYF